MCVHDLHARIYVHMYASEWADLPLSLSCPSLLPLRWPLKEKGIKRRLCFVRAATPDNLTPLSPPPREIGSRGGGYNEKRRGKKFNRKRLVRLHLVILSQVHTQKIYTPARTQRSITLPLVFFFYIRDYSSLNDESDC